MSFAPRPPLGTYAAIRMDLAAMVAHLDTRAMEEAQEICPKTYLILTACSLSSTSSGRNKWYTYNVCPVGPSLRAVDEKRGYESDMCVPIFPNEAHPAARSPVRPSSAFPYDNCYHWAAMDLDVRVHAREEGFDKTRAIRLPVRERMDMELLFRPDLGRAKCTRLAREQTASVPPDSASPSTSSFLLTTEQPKDVAASDGTDIFQPPQDSEDPEYIPLFDLWLDLAANLKQEDIGDPVDLYRERFQIMNIIKRAHERNEDLPTLREHMAPQQNAYTCDSDSDSYVSGTDSQYCQSETDVSKLEDDYVGKPKRFWPGKLLRKLRKSVHRVLCTPIH